ncbi:UNVERIFIED_CONTAM: cytochrome [Sesamum radiatum]|uniref:Cytochrome n=1 Tax=Sesamum radiatum TaxID=300843 RepID=A0AAW2R0B0_SESRA
MSTDEEVNQYIFQQEGKIFQAWNTESALRIAGEQGLLAHAGNSHKYLRDLVLNVIGPQHLKTELLHEMDTVTRKHLSLWTASHEVDVKTAMETMVFELVTKKLLGFEGGKGREKAMRMIRSTINARRSNSSNGHDFLDELMREIEDEKTIMTQEIAEDMLFLLLFAAFETTSTTITLALHFLHQHPYVLQHLKKRQLVSQDTMSYNLKLSALQTLRNGEPNNIWNPLNKRQHGLK